MQRVLRLTDLPLGNQTVAELATEYRTGNRQAVLGHLRLLGRLATKIKTNDIQEAVSCMERHQALSILIEQDQGQTMVQLLRLPLFLQQAGRMPEALVEFQRLLNWRRTYHADARPVMSQEDRDGVWHGDRADVYDKLRLAWQREQRPDEAKAAMAKSIDHREKNRAWHCLAEVRRAAERAAYAAERARRRDEMDGAA